MTEADNPRTCPVAWISAKRGILTTTKTVDCPGLSCSALQELTARMNRRSYPDLEAEARAVIASHDLPGLALIWRLYSSRTGPYPTDEALVVPEPLSGSFGLVLLDDRVKEFMELAHRVCQETGGQLKRKNLAWRVRPTFGNLIGCVFAASLLITDSLLLRGLALLGVAFWLASAVCYWFQPSEWFIRPGGVTTVSMLVRKPYAFDSRDTVLVLRPSFAHACRHGDTPGWWATLYGKGRRCHRLLSQLECVMLLAAWRTASGLAPGGEAERLAPATGGGSGDLAAAPQASSLNRST